MLKNINPTNRTFCVIAAVAILTGAQPALAHCGKCAVDGLALAKAHEKVTLGAIAAAEGHARQARAMVAAEMATEADLLQAEVYLSGLLQRLSMLRVPLSDRCIQISSLAPAALVPAHTCKPKTYFVSRFRV